MSKTLTPKELAVQVGTDPRTLRKFLRSITPVEERPGKGNRWEIESRSVKSLAAKFSKWDEARKAAADETNEDEVPEGDTALDES